MAESVPTAGAGIGPVTAALTRVLDEARRASPPGSVATYIPELASADPERFGISVVSALGHGYSAGDATDRFTIQSISKPFVYALALEELGADAVSAHVGVEPSGQPFDAAGLDAAGRPANPMINIGAITVTSLIPAESVDERTGRIRAALSAFAGRPLQVDDGAYRSEAATARRNRELAAAARESGALVGDPDDVLDAYFRQCALLVSSLDLAAMGATLANGGTHPITGERVVSEATARRTLSVMAGCGMYDRSGDWLVDVGMPAKSGVGGGIVAVTPGAFGIGVFSPPLDEAGNSARGVAALKALTAAFRLHLFDRPVTPVSSVESIERREDGAVVVVLRGELDFLAAERAAYEIAAALEDGDDRVVVDLRSVTRSDTAASGLLRVLATRGRPSVEFLDDRLVLGG